MTVRARGRSYEDGPYTFCDQADLHPQPCMCAAPQVGMAAVQDYYHREVTQEAPPVGGCYWPIEDMEES